MYFWCGGAAVSIACSLASQNIKSLKIINRNVDKANELMKKVKVINKNLFVEVDQYKDNSNYTI